MNPKTSFIRSYRFILILAIVVGGLGILIQFIPDYSDFYFFLPLVVLGDLIGRSRDYEEQDRQQLEQSYQLCFEWLLLIILAAYAFILFSRWLYFLEGAVIHLNGSLARIYHLYHVCFTGGGGVSQTT